MTTVEALSRRQRLPRRVPICVRLGDGWWAAAFGVQLREQAELTAEDRRFRLVEADATRTLQAEVADHRARGVIIRSPADPAVVEQVESLVRVDVPVVTVGSDLPAPNRTGFAGTHLVRAGNLVAARVLESAPGVQVVLMVTPGGWHYGDQELEQGFRHTLRQAGVRLVTVSSRDHDHQPAVRSRLEAAVTEEPAIDAVFALGVGAGEALDVLRAAGRTISWAGAWGQSPDHVELLRTGALDVVAGTSLEIEARLALQMVSGVPALGRPSVGTRPTVEFWDRAALPPHG